MISGIWDVFSTTIFLVPHCVMKDILVGLILSHTDIIFHSDIKPWNIVKCRSSRKLTELHSSRKIGDANCNVEKFIWGYCPPEVAITLLNSEQTHTFCGLPTYDIWYLGCILYHLLFGSPLCNVDGQKINSLLSIFVFHCFHFSAMFMLLFLAFLGIFKKIMRIL